MAARERLQQQRNNFDRANTETAGANERQRLRRELDAVRKDIETYTKSIDVVNAYNRKVDADEDGMYLASDGPCWPQKSTSSSDDQDKSVWSVADCRAAVVKGELQWTIEGMSWLESTLDQAQSSTAYSAAISVGSSQFLMQYGPDRCDTHSRAIGETMNSSLSLVQQNAVPLTLRHSFFIKRSDGEFVQWGVTVEECFPQDDTEGWQFGPDTRSVRLGDEVAAGIFGHSHEELLRSEWVSNDALTVKVKLEVREDRDMEKEMETSITAPTAIELPPPTMIADLLAQLDGESGDVTFFVEGERLRAHAVILCARSEVFRHMLRGSMREAGTREVTIDECDAVTFRALLRHIYTDDLVAMEAWVKEKAAESVEGEGGGAGGGEGSSSGDDAGNGAGLSSEQSPADAVAAARMALLQRVLAVSHRYQVSRLRLWCEKQLAETMGVTNVSGCLCLAHLYEANALEDACLEYISANHAKVSVTKEFGTLGAECPAVMLKVVHRLAGVQAAEAAPALEAATAQGTKRKRADDL